MPLAAILVLAALARWHHLADVSYDFDEACSWKLTTFPVTETGSRLAHDLPPPLYFYSLWAWSRLFGHSPEVLRSLSVAFGLLTVLAAYLLAREVGSEGREDSGERERSSAHRSFPGAIGPDEVRMDASHGEQPALAAAALFALSPLQVDFSQRARMYSFGAALTVASCWLLLRSLRHARPRWRDYILYALAAAALSYTHSFGLLIIAAQFLYTLGWLTSRGESFAHAKQPRPGPLCGREDEQVGGTLALQDAGGSTLGKGRLSHRTGAATAFAIVALLYLPWAANFLWQWQQASQHYPSEPFAWQAVAKACYQTLAVRWEDWPPSVAVAWCATAACFLPALAMLLWGHGGLRLIGLCVLVTFDAVIAFSVSAQNVLMSRYLVFANALLLCGLPPLIAAWGPTRTSQQRERRFGRAFGGAATAALVAGMGWLCLAHAERREGYARHPGIMAAMAYLAEVAQEQEPIVVSNPMVQIAAASHAVGQPPPLVLSSSSSSFPYFQGSAFMRPDEYVSPRALDALGCRRVWAIDAMNCFAGTWAVQLSDDWIDVSEEVFPVSPSPSSQIVVRCYERRRYTNQDNRHASH